MTYVEQELIIEPGQGLKNYWRDLWRYRELFYFLAWRDIAVRYKQTVIGVAWSIIRPVLTMIVFSVIFGRLAGLCSFHRPGRPAAGGGLWYFRKTERSFADVI